MFTFRKEKQFSIPLLRILVGILFQLAVCLSYQCCSADEVDSAFFKHYYESVGDRLYNSKEIPGNLLLALENYKKALRYLPNQSGIEWKITRCLWVLATKAIKPEDRNAYFKEGIRYGKLSVKNNPDSSNAHLWFSLVIGSSAMDRGVVRTLYNRELIRSHLETALKLNPKNTNAYVGLAGWFFYVPNILGGNKAKALKYINQAINLEPNYTSARFVKAEFLLQENRLQEAAETLKNLLSVKNPVIRGDGVENKEKARKILARLKTKKALI